MPKLACRRKAFYHKAIRNNLTILFILSLVIPILSLEATEPANAQTLPTPAVPEFTVMFVNNSYSTQPTTTTTTDPYTGKQTVTTVPSQYVENEYIEVSIKNQAFTPYTINYHNIDNRTVNLYFNVRSKGHFSDDWSHGGLANVEMSYGSQYTTVQLYINNVPSPALIDFEVQAVIGYLVNQYNPEAPLPPPNTYDPNFIINGTESAWSNPQTLTITAGSTSPTPAVPEFPTSALLAPFLVLSLSAVTVLTLRKRKIPSTFDG